MAPAVEAQNPNHWTAREVPRHGDFEASDGADGRFPNQSRDHREGDV